MSVSRAQGGVKPCDGVGNPLPAMYLVRATAYGYFAREDEPAPEVPVEDIFAAATMMSDARDRLDALEHDLLRAARTRGASWATIADALGLGTRQSAESRALRLERTRRASDRDVAAQRADRVRQRSADAWLADHEEQIRTVCEQVVDTAGAWPHLTANPRARVHRLAATLASGAGPAHLADGLAELKAEIAPYSGKPVPVGPRAAAAAEARDAMLALLRELWGVRCGFRSPSFLVGKQELDQVRTPGRTRRSSARATVLPGDGPDRRRAMADVPSRFP